MVIGVCTREVDRVDHGHGVAGVGHTGAGAHVGGRRGRGSRRRARRAAGQQARRAGQRGKAAQPRANHPGGGPVHGTRTERGSDLGPGASGARPDRGRIIRGIIGVPIPLEPSTAGAGRAGLPCCVAPSGLVGDREEVAGSRVLLGRAPGRRHRRPGPPPRPAAASMSSPDVPIPALARTAPGTWR